MIVAELSAESLQGGPEHRLGAVELPAGDVQLADDQGRREGLLMVVAEHPAPCVERGFDQCGGVVESALAFRQRREVVGGRQGRGVFRSELTASELECSLQLLGGSIPGRQVHVGRPDRVVERRPHRIGQLGVLSEAVRGAVENVDDPALSGRCAGRRTVRIG